jgi:hypothetical protein
VIDDQVDRDEGIDRARIAPEPLDRVAHRRQVDDRGHAREVLHKHPGGLERDLLRGLGLGVPRRDRFHVVRPNRVAVLEPERVLEQHLQRVREPRDVELLLQDIEPMDLVLAPRYLERGTRSEAVRVAHTFSMPPRVRGP